MQQFPICEACPGATACLARFRTVLEQQGYELVTEGTLAKYRASVHWHIRKRGERSGTLEYTMAPSTGRAWFAVHENRLKPWVLTAVEELTPLACGRAQ